MLLFISKRCIILIFLLAIICLYFIVYLSFYLPLKGDINNYKYLGYDGSRDGYSIWKSFHIPQTEIECFSSSELDYDIEKLISELQSFKKTRPKNGRCKYVLDLFYSIFEVSHRYSRTLDFPNVFESRLKKRLDYDLFNSLSHQLTIHLVNRITLEHSVYNPLRSKRPVSDIGENIWSYIEMLSNETKKTCDFCNYKYQTAVDELGRHETAFTVRVTNTFKLEKWHGMVITKKHHPIKYSWSEFETLFSDVVNWAKEVQTVDPSYIYPSASWDVLYKAGASQIHPHIHTYVSPNHYYGKVEYLRRAAQNYYEKTNENYFTRLVEIYSALGLAVPFGKAVALCTLAGNGDLEVMILSDTPSSDSFKLLYFTLEVYHELQFPCHSMLMAWSALGLSDSSKVGKIPAIVRVVTRGNCLAKVNDISAIDLFLTNFRDHDPWLLSKLLVEKISANFRY